MKRMVTGPVVLVVLDGWGLRQESEHNGVALARTTSYDQLVSSFPFTQLQASGEAVGLPDGQMGNSEVGHTTIGAGCVLYQDLVRINKDSAAGAFIHNHAFKKAFEHVQTNQSQLHILGIVSPGGVHGHEEHLMAALKAARQSGIDHIVLHVFLDGRDSSKTAGQESLKKLEILVAELGGCHIGSVMGRYYSMDRDTNWERTDKAVEAIFQGKADQHYSHTIAPSQIIQEMYHQEVFDEHMQPIVFLDQAGKPFEVKDNDALIFTNFRKDRAKQISARICSKTTEKNLCFVTMTQYGGDLSALVAYTPQEITMTLGKAVAQAGLKQVRIAETEKFPHATYFLNGGQEQPFDGETDVLIPSQKVATHDMAPEMRAREICDAALEHLDCTDFMFINFANPDMVGHTANEKAIITAIEVVDHQLGRLTQAVLEKNGAVLVIADHGNAELIIDPVTGEPHTAHTTNLVPCILVSHLAVKDLRHDSPGLQDVAPTILQLLGLPKPEEMTGESMICL